MKILLLEDDLILNEVIEEFLHSLNYQVTSSYDGKHALELIYDESFDLLILDVNVPGLDGLAFLKEVRANNIKTPAIFVTSRDTIEDVEEGFLSGCDDYLKKPFELKELELRINNIKRFFNLETKVIEITPQITFNSEENILINEGFKTQMPLKEAKILLYFINHKNHTISQDELISNIWAFEDHPSSSTIRTYIKNIRKLIGEDILQTIKGVGYRFNI